MDSDLLAIGRETLRKEAKALTQYIDTIDEGFDRACHAILDCKGTVILTGMGKSGLVAKKWASTFASTGTKAYFLNPAEAQHGELGVMHENDLLIALSYSGETEELEPLLLHAKEFDISIIGVTGKPSSSLGKDSSIVLSVASSEEACPLNLAPTTSTTIMMALGDAIAVTLMQMRKFTEQDFARLHPGGALGRRLWLRVESIMHTGLAMPTVLPDEPFETVLLTMTQKHLGLAIVLDEAEKILGVITDGDLRRCFQNGKAKPETTAKEIMTADPKVIHPKTLAIEARDIMEEHSIHHLVIVADRGKAVGVIHLDDLLRAKIL